MKAVTEKCRCCGAAESEENKLQWATVMGKDGKWLCPFCLNMEQGKYIADRDERRAKEKQQAPLIPHPV